MKILNIAFSGLPLFKGKVEVDFIASQRVKEGNELSFLFQNGKNNYYANNVISFIGLNASGKTSVLKVLSFVFSLLNNEPLNNTKYPEIFDGLKEKQEVTFKISFLSSQSLYFLSTSLVKKEKRLFITNESLKEKSIKTIKTKSDLFNQDNAKCIMQRNDDEAFLSDDVSIMIAFNKQSKDKAMYTDMLKYTNENHLALSEDCPAELITFFDPSIEHINVKQVGKDKIVSLKFYKKPEIILNRINDVERYLSSGTIKGINLFLNAFEAFQKSGYLLIDELENHFNHEIVSTLLHFYMNKNINAAGATLLFSTHYAELLDQFQRNDCIYIARNINGISIENLSKILNRNDIKKSGAYQSDFLKGTAPKYDAYIALKNKLLVNGEKENG